MMKRKHICLIISNINGYHEKRILEGTKSQCKKYDYDLSVFFTKDVLSYYEKAFVDGEINIYNLINYKLFDGVVIDPLGFAGSTETLEKIIAAIKSQYEGPVVTLSLQCEDFPLVETQNEEILREMCQHMVTYHHYNKIFILTGPKGNSEGESRLEIFLDELGKCGVSMNDNQIFYGDFWYTSGENLAKKIISGELEKPDAVICASDHMAIGLTGELTKGGVKVPEDVAVIGFEGTLVAKLNAIPLSSYESNDAKAGAMAIDYIKSTIDPDIEVAPYESDIKSKFCRGRSCGCKTDSADFVKNLGPYIYHNDTNFSDDGEGVRSNIGVLLDSYCYEELCSATDVESCINKIAGAAFFIHPFETFYLCLREDWLDVNNDIIDGYPEKMKLVVERNKDHTLPVCSNQDGKIFDTELMLPDLFAEREEPAVFYFNAVHFNNIVFGFCVMRRKMDLPPLDIVYKNWIRFVTNSLEMTRAKNRYMVMSVLDSMTGLYNRRGMTQYLEMMINTMTASDKLFVAVIDMDGLKYINDTFGHKDGDACINRLGCIIRNVLSENEIAVRAGGDEFYIVGVGEYTSENCEAKKENFLQAVSENGVFPDKEYNLSASIGYTLWNHENKLDLDELITRADEKMYQFKVARKMNRKKEK